MWSCCAALRADKETQGKAEGENNVRELLQVRFGEIHLKGQNRPYFMQDAGGARPRGGERRCRAMCGSMTAGCTSATMTDMDECHPPGDEGLRRTQRLPGRGSGQRTTSKRSAPTGLKLLENHHGTFKINARRSDKRYPMDCHDHQHGNGRLYSGAPPRPEGGCEEPCT